MSWATFGILQFPLNFSGDWSLEMTKEEDSREEVEEENCAYIRNADSHFSSFGIGRLEVQGPALRGVPLMHRGRKRADFEWARSSHWMRVLGFRRDQHKGSISLETDSRRVNMWSEVPGRSQADGDVLLWTCKMRWSQSSAEALCHQPSRRLAVVEHRVQDTEPNTLHGLPCSGITCDQKGEGHSIITVFRQIVFPRPHKQGDLRHFCLQRLCSDSRLSLQGQV